MLQESEELRGLMAVRDGQIAVVTCAACGCRLELSPSMDGSWRHFGAIGGRDARGCRTACVEAPHDALGRSAIPA
jgi:hypothetical protein